MLLSPPPDSPSRDLSRNNWTRAGSPLPGGVEGRKSPGWVEPSLALPSHSFLLKKKIDPEAQLFPCPTQVKVEGANLGIDTPSQPHPVKTGQKEPPEWGKRGGRGGN